MINTKTYEEIKNGLVNKILTDYTYYKRELDSFKSKIEQGQNFYAFKSETPISQQSSAKRSASYALKATTKEDEFLIELGNLSERFNYIKNYKLSYNKVLDRRESLIENIKDLVSFNKLTKEKFSDKNDATVIFDPIKNYAINEHLVKYFQSIEMKKHVIDKYLENKDDLYLKGIAFKEDDHYKIDNDGLKKKENVFFEEVLKAIEQDLEQIQKIENKKESENYLKYWLLFK
ncbi:hypothetical protein FPV13_14515 (plasmid) [Mammaliicoccus sciuri]|uniref:Uncharacterized protein n=1 Tax=Mammaliicoccus sciuri TaxID=1296 RepID=A0A517CM75_MAMSC|nr:hypothetical protein [Mammaliicoccus sciuri]QDR66111.1 hypothetical protein FPV13_14515 [Mammaliicoccus sciuri]